MHSQRKQSTNYRELEQRSPLKNTYHTPQRVWAGHGQGNPCTRCGAPIRASDIEYEVELERQPALHFHLPCYQKWDAEAKSSTR